MRGFSSKLGASFKSLQDSLATKLDVPAYTPQPASAAAAKESTPHAHAAAPVPTAPEAEWKSQSTTGNVAVVKPEHAFSLGE